MSDLDVKGLREWLEQLEYYEGKLAAQITGDHRRHYENARRACLLLIKATVGRELRRENQDSQVATTWSLKLERGDLLRSASEFKKSLEEGRVPKDEREKTARLIVGLELQAMELTRLIEEAEAEPTEG